MSALVHALANLTVENEAAVLPGIGGNAREIGGRAGFLRLDNDVGDLGRR